MLTLENISHKVTLHGTCSSFRHDDFTTAYLACHPCLIPLLPDVPPFPFFSSFLDSSAAKGTGKAENPFLARMGQRGEQQRRIFLPLSLLLIPPPAAAEGNHCPFAGLVSEIWQEELWEGNCFPVSLFSSHPFAHRIRMCCFSNRAHNRGLGQTLGKLPHGKNQITGSPQLTARCLATTQRYEGPPCSNLSPGFKVPMVFPPPMVT